MRRFRVGQQVQYYLTPHKAGTDGRLLVHDNPDEPKSGRGVVTAVVYCGRENHYSVQPNGKGTKVILCRCPPDEVV